MTTGNAIVALFAAATLVGATAHAQADFPSRPITIVVPQQAGSASDVMMRIVAQHMSTTLKQSIVIDNRIGAGGNIGTVFVARAKADGYTLLINGNSHVINPPLYKNAGFDPIKDFVPVAKIAEGSLVLVANPAFEAKTIGDLIRLGQSNPGKIFYSSPGNGSLNQLAVVMLEQATKASFTHVPYKGAPASVADVAGGQVPFTVSALASARPLLASGQLKAIAVTNRTRLKALPDVPAINETVTSFDITPWYGLFAPKGTSAAVVNRIHDAVNSALKNAEVRSQLEKQGLMATPQDVSSFSAMVEDETSAWSATVKRSGAKVD